MYEGVSSVQESMPVSAGDSRESSHLPIVVKII